MKLTKIKLAKDASNRLRFLAGRTGLTPNLLCRLGFCLSLAEPTQPRVDEYREEEREFNRYTLLGEYDALFIAVFKQRCHADGIAEDELPDYFRAHLNRGVTLLQQRTRGLSDLLTLVPRPEALPQGRFKDCGLCMAEDDISVERHRTAIHRIALSRPVRLALQSDLIRTQNSVFDYGCGHGDDVRLLEAGGIPASGWDPFHRAHVVKSPASIVNLGYVLNVIEDTEERREALLGAWELAGNLLIVAARTTLEEAEDAASFGDGTLTSRRTFQKFYTQGELQDYIRETIAEEPVAAVSWRVLRLPSRG